MPTIISRAAASAKGFGFAGLTIPPLYNFNSFTFNPAGTTGRYGPSLTTCQSAYSGQPWLTSYFTMVTQGYQRWTVPKNGTYTLAIAGSRAGLSPNQAASSGNGVVIQADIPLVQGHILEFICGQYEDSPYSITNQAAMGGGGGTFVYNTNTSTLLMAAGGGGGAGIYGPASAGGDASTNTYGGDISFSALLYAGSNGLGGNVWGSTGYCGGGGSGWLGEGHNGDGGIGKPYSRPSGYHDGEGGWTYSQGFYGGDWGTGWPAGAPASRGGFGGGGGSNGYTTGGGGGGYSGGASTGYGGSYYPAGGGGGSYIAQTATNVATTDGKYSNNTTFNSNPITYIGSYNNSYGYVFIKNTSNTYPTYGNLTISYSIGSSGAGGTGGQVNGSPGGNTTITFTGYSLTAYGGQGGIANLYLASGGTANGGSASITGDYQGIRGVIKGGSGTGMITSIGGGSGGGAIGNTAGSPYSGSPSGGIGANNVNIYNLQSTVTALGISWVGVGSNPSGNATGFGCGGGGAAAAGGFGGNGYYGGGGGGSAGGTPEFRGGNGGSGCIVIRMTVGGALQNVILTSGNSYTTPSLTSSLTLWAVGGGGGGAGCAANTPSSAGGGGAAGGVAYVRLL